MDPSQLNRIREYIDHHHTRQVTVAQLAQRAGLSVFHFIRAFRASTGTTPHQYVRMRRIKRWRAGSDG